MKRKLNLKSCLVIAESAHNHKKYLSFNDVLYIAYIYVYLYIYIYMYIYTYIYTYIYIYLYRKAKFFVFIVNLELIEMFGMSLLTE